MDNHICVRCASNLCVEKVSVFASLSHDDMLEIVKMTGHKTYKKGEFLCHEGDTLAMLFIVNKGKVKLSKFNKEGKEQILNIISEGGIFGEYHLFSDFEPYNYSAIALSDMKICTLTKQDMDYLLKKHQDISYKILYGLSKKLIQAENLVQNISTINTSSKVAYVLMDLADNYGIKDGKAIRLEMPINREEMANYAGVTRETVSRKLNTLENQDIIKTIGNKVIIINEPDILEDMI